MFYGDPNPVIRPAGLGIAEIDGLQRDVAVVIGPPGTYPLLGIMFLKAFSLRLTIDPLNNLVELVPSARVRLLPE